MDMVAYKALASTIRPIIAKGVTRILITSSGPREGKSTIASNLSRALASTGKYRVALIDADLMRPTVHDNFAMPQRRGLTDLMNEIYATNLQREQKNPLGLGDWIELARAQSRTGTLTVTSGDQQFSLTLEKGRITSISGRNLPDAERLGGILVAGGKVSEEQRDVALKVQKQGPRRIGDVLHSLGYIEPADLDAALMTQVKNTVHQLVTLPAPKITFVDSPEYFLPNLPGAGDDADESGAIDQFVTDRFGDYLKTPFLASQIPPFFADTDIQNLKLLLRGESEYDITDAAFEVFLHRASKMFDVVIIDAPPVAVTSPAITLARMAHGVLFVVKSEGYDLRIVQQAKENLASAGANLLGVVLNQINVKSDPYVAYYYGSYKR